MSLIDYMWCRGTLKCGLLPKHDGPCLTGNEEGLIVRIDELRASLAAAERERDEALALLRQVANAPNSILAERDAARARVEVLEGALRDLLFASDPKSVRVAGEELDATWSRAHAAVDATKKNPPTVAAACCTCSDIPLSRDSYHHDWCALLGSTGGGQ